MLFNSEIKQITKGSVRAAKNAVIHELDGFRSPNATGIIRTAVILTGYKPETMFRPEFQDYLEEDRLFSGYFFDIDMFDTGYFFIDDNLPISINAIGSGLPGVYRKREIATLAHKIKAQFGHVDMIEFRFEPSLLMNCFSAANTLATVTKGPWLKNGGSLRVYRDEYQDYVHERLHLLSLKNMKYDPAFFGDAYKLGSLEGCNSYLVRNGAFSEGFLEDPNNKGFPIPTISPVVYEAIRDTRPRFYDTGLTLEFEKKRARILTTNPLRSNIMMGGYGLSIEDVELSREMYLSMFSEFQEALLRNIAQSYIANRDNLAQEFTSQFRDACINIGRRTTRLIVPQAQPETLDYSDCALERVS